MTKRQLMDEIIVEIGRIFGSEGFHGDFDEYAWLLENYGISEEDDVRWQEVCEHERDDLLEDLYEDDEFEELMKFLEDDQAVVDFLGRLLSCYRTSSIEYRK